MQFKPGRLLDIAVLAVATLYILFKLVIPFLASLYAYNQYHHFAHQYHYVNAIVHQIDNKSPKLGLFNKCTTVLTYNVPVEDNIFQAKDKLGCGYQTKVSKGDLVPVFVNSERPPKIVSDNDLASSSHNLAASSPKGLAGIILIFYIWRAYRQSIKPRLDYLTDY